MSYSQCQRFLLYDFVYVHECPWHPLYVSLETPKCENQLERVEKQIEKTISQMMQSTLNSLERDSEKVATAIDQMLDRDR